MPSAVSVSPSPGNAARIDRPEGRAERPSGRSPGSSSPLRLVRSFVSSRPKIRSASPITETSRNPVVVVQEDRPHLERRLQVTVAALDHPLVLVQAQDGRGQAEIGQQSVDPVRAPGCRDRLGIAAEGDRGPAAVGAGPDAEQALDRGEGLDHAPLDLRSEAAEAAPRSRRRSASTRVSTSPSSSPARTWPRAQSSAGRSRRPTRALWHAEAIFEELGAQLWLDKTPRELTRTGITRSLDRELTPTESRVAELAATGARNEEIAGAPFVSVKTVEANLSRVYAKLGVRSRVELASRLEKTCS
jgi:DNA-binding CsgD family transcriptional regulator